MDTGNLGRYLMKTRLLFGLLALPAFSFGQGQLLFQDDFTRWGADQKPAAHWSIYGDSGGNADVFVETLGDPSPFLRVRHSGGGAVVQVMLRNRWTSAAPQALSVSFDFAQMPDAGPTRFSLRAGRERVFSTDRTHEVRFEGGMINQRYNLYRNGRVNRITAVFNNSTQTLSYPDGQGTLASDRVDVWVNGERVIAGGTYMRGGLAVGQALQSVTFDLPAGMEQELLIGRVRVHGGLHVEPYEGEGSLTFSEWLAAQKLSGEEQAPESVLTEDGVPNLMKFAQGFDATESAAALKPVLEVDENGDRHFWYAVTPFRQGIQYRVQHSENLNDWTSLYANGVSKGSPAGNGAHWFKMPLEQSSAHPFVRLAVESAGFFAEPVYSWKQWAETLSLPMAVLPDSSWDPEAAGSPRTVLIPPGTRLDPDVRLKIDRHRRNSGLVIWLSPEAVDYSPEIQDPVEVFTPGTTSYTMIQPSSSQVNPAPEVIHEVYNDGDLGQSALRVWTRLIGDGNVMVEMPLGEYAHPDRDTFRIWARGEYDMDILYLIAIDAQDRQWTAFRQLPMEWTRLQVPFADFLSDLNDDNVGLPGLNPADIRRLRMGIGRFIVWPEVQGAFSIGPVELGSSGMEHPVPTGEVSEWHVQYARFNMDVSSAWRDPYRTGRWLPGSHIHPVDGDPDAAPLAAPLASLREIPAPPTERGREATQLRDILDRDHYFQRPLLELRRADSDEKAGIAAELRHWHGGEFAGSSELLMTWAPFNPATSPAWDAWLRETVERLQMHPQIRNIEARTSALNQSDQRMRLVVSVHNPSPTPFLGRLRLEVDGVGMMGVRDITVLGNSTASVDLPLDNVDDDFPMAAFSWDLQLTNRSGRVFDTYRDEVDVERLIARSTRYFLDLQKKHRDVRMSHYFFADIYAVRFLYQFARYLDERPATRERLADVLGGYDTTDMRNAALAWIDHIADNQSEDGSFPMGYGEHRGVRFLGDLGQIAFGIAQLTSWLDTGDPRRERYLDVVRNLMEFRQSLYIDEARAVELEAKFGPNPETIQPGFYGMGLLDSDYFDGGRFPDGLQLEERGRWWVLPLTMSSVAALSQLDDNPWYHEISLRDVNFYLDEDFALSSVTYFHIESLLWKLYVHEDEALRQRIRTKAAEFLPTAVNGNPRDDLSFQGRAVVRMLSLLYYDRYVQSSPRFRNVLLQHLWNFDLESSSYSLDAIANKYPRTSYGPHIAAFRYHAYAAMWMLEWLDEGATLLKDKPFVP